MKSSIKLTQLLKYFVITAISALIVSCSGKPSISDFEIELNEQIENESSVMISLVELEKTNSEEKEFFGQKAYSMDYIATIYFNVDCWIYVNQSGIGPKFNNFNAYLDEPEFLPSLGYVATYFKSGETVKFKGRVNYFETENGWERK